MRAAGGHPPLFDSGRATGSGAASVAARSSPQHEPGLVVRVMDAQTRLILLPWTLALTGLASTVGLAARALTAVGFPPPGCAPAGDLAAAAAALEAARAREGAYRAALSAAQADVEALARDRRRAAAKLAKARAELVAGRAEGGGPERSAASPLRPAGGPPGSPGALEAEWEAGGDDAHPHPCPDASVSARASACSMAALATAALWWGKAGPTWPALAHKALLAVGGLWALTLAWSTCGRSRRGGPGMRVPLFAGAWAMVGFVAAHWLVVMPGEGWSELR